MGFKSTYANRGTVLEHYVEQANATYRQRNIAAIHKNPPPVKVTKQNRNGSIEGFIEGKGYVDYSGVRAGKHISFDAKETTDKNKFPLQNIKQHQYEDLEADHYQKGISFILLYFVAHQEAYILTFSQLEYWWAEVKNGGRKSIPYKWIQENCRKCAAGRGIALDYLSAL
jgi:recombination protein U